ncbi:putative lipoprotein [Pedobacter sp. BAL39]|uniref:RagB/SusD family nutrient uptake outer membrane protein n=1 Tax=Pedobacter sp. BAL39 TaxID=391596 RepID=UPI0001559503|nr:RagB/SusD family nutrient uptake outer membrane protein [Pedobacter sp. BAL39]EDM36888.1 putative lipoprotein [Pedobacter sp. BAL39]
MNKIIKLAAVALVVLSASSCKKYLDIEPAGRVIPKTTEDFRGLLTSAYNFFPAHKSLLAVRTDELLMDEYATGFPAYKDIYAWNDNDADGLTSSMPYTAFYTSIFNANHVIAEVEKEAGVSPETAQIKGEAYLLRAYAHFELLNLYAKPYNAGTAATDRGIVLSLAIDLEQNYKTATVAEVYAQILADIEAGRQLLNVTNFDAGFNYRFTKRAAAALTARVYEFKGDWANALASSQQALALNGDLEDLNVTGAVLPNNYRSKENIMSMEKAFDAGVTNTSMISDHLLNIYDQANDLRYPMYFGRAFGNTVSLKGAFNENKISFRNGELYLIQAEAALQSDNLALALKSLLDLKVKRLKPAYYQTEATRISALAKPALLQEILNERERELALEGHRWYDLRRYGQPELVHSFENGSSYTLQKNDPKYTIRFPREAVANNPNLQ